MSLVSASVYYISQLYVAIIYLQPVKTSLQPTCNLPATHLQHASIYYLQNQNTKHLIYNCFTTSARLHSRLTILYLQLTCVIQNFQLIEMYQYQI